MMAVKMPGLGLDARGDGEGHRQRQRDDADGEAGAQVAPELRAVVALAARRAGAGGTVQLHRGRAAAVGAPRRGVVRVAAPVGVSPLGT